MSDGKPVALNRGLVVIFVLAFLLLGVSAVQAQNDINFPPIDYETTEPNDRVAKLIQQLESGEATLAWDDEHGWLPDLLSKLEIPSTSQSLVFSKTSLQTRKIDPTSARAVYFNEDVYLGFIRNGDFVEIAAVDPVQGAIFYKLDQGKTREPKIKRATAKCLACHQSHRTQDVPGFLTRSVYPKNSGHPEFRLGTTPTDHRTEFLSRFGGWYVTGQHGSMRHRGNVFLDPASDTPDVLDREAGANLGELPSVSDPDQYLEPTSDIVALMIMEHQTQFHNFVTQASYTTRQARHYQTEMNKIMERDPDYESESTRRRIRTAAEKLVEYTLFCDEFQLTSPVSGSPGFIEDFSRTAVRDSKGRSLKDLDLNSRLLKYPCSYLIYTDAFCSLPEEVLELVKTRMLEVLEGHDDSEKFQHLGEQDRAAILEILKTTHPVFREQQPTE